MKNKIYEKSPVWAQNIGLSLYAWYRDKMFRRNKYFSEAVKLVNQINNSTPAEIEKWQLKQLNWIVNYALENTKFYKEFYGVDKVEIRTMEDFYQLPIIDKQIVRDNWEKLQVSVKDKVFNSSTSGTTGSSLRLRISQNNMAVEEAGIYCDRKDFNFSKKSKIASFTSRKLINRNRKIPPYWRYNCYDNQLLFSIWHVEEETLPYYIDKINQFNPDFINGYPSFLHLVSEHAIRTNSALIQPKSIFTSSESLLPFQKHSIENAFKTSIVDSYGTGEKLVNARQCIKGAYHVREELGYLEIIDSEIHGTTFHNIAMPLIRYNIGDIAKWDKSICSCNRSGRIIKSIEGRKDDIIISKNGRKFSRVSRIFQNTPNIKEAQIIQKSILELDINIVFQGPDHDLSYVDKLVNEKFGSEFVISYKIMDEIPRTSNGKFRFVISRINKDPVIL